MSFVSRPWDTGLGFAQLRYCEKYLSVCLQPGSVPLHSGSWPLFSVAFPSLITFAGDDASYSSAAVGESGYYTVNVLDSGLQTLLGSSNADINYDLPSWVVPASTASGEVLVRGSVLFYENWTNMVTKDVPLVIAGSDNGRILYTSFHNEAQTTLDMDRMLEQMALDL